jgi:chemotaxis signal transduction protein
MLVVTCGVGSRRLAVPAAQLRAVLPFAVAGGALDRHGEQIPVADLSLLLGEGPSPAFYSTRLLVGERIALVAPNATETLAVRDEDLAPLPADAPPWITASFTMNEQTYWLLDLVALGAAHAR